MGFNDTIGLLFKISADASDARKALAELSGDVERTSKKAKQDMGSVSAADFSGLSGNAKGAASEITNLAQGFTLSAGETSKLAAVLPVAGAAIAAVAAVAAVAVTASIALGKELYNLAQKSADYGKEIGDAAKQTGLTIDTVSALKFGVEAAGKKFSDVSEPLDEFARRVGEAARGSDEAKDKLIALGINPQEAINDLDGTLAKVFTRIASLPPGIQQSNAAMDAFGEQGAKIIPFINSFGGDLEGLTQKAREFGVVLSTEDVQAAEEFKRSYTMVSAQLQNIIFQFSKEYMPAISQVFNDTNNFLQDNRQTVREWGEEFGRIIRGITAIMESDVAKWTASILNFVAFTGLQNLADVIKYFDPQSGQANYNPNQPYSPTAPNGQYNGEVNSSSPFMPPLDSPYDITGKKKLPTITKEDLQGNYLQNLEKDREEAEKLADEYEKQAKADLNAQIQIRKNYLQAAQEDLSKAFSRLQEIFQKTGDSKFFNEQITNAIESYKDRVRDILTILNPLEAQQQIALNKAPAELQLLVDNQAKRQSDLADKAVDVQTKAEKVITDNAKKQAQERNQIIKDETAYQIALRAAANKAVYAKAESGNFSDADLLRTKQGLEGIYATTNNRADMNDPRNTIFQAKNEKGETYNYDVIEGFLAFKKKKLLEELERVKGETKEEARIYKELGLLKVEIETTYFNQKKEQTDLGAKETKKNADEEIRQNERILRIKYEVLKAENDIVEFRREQERKSIVNSVDLLSGSARRDALSALRDFDIAESARRKQALDTEAESQKQIALAEAQKIKDLEKRKEVEEQINKLFRERVKLSGEEKAAQDADTEKQYANSVRNSKSSEYGGGIFGEFMGSMAVITDPTVSANEKMENSIKSLSGAYDLLKGTAGSAINGMIAGAQDLLAQWILTGKGSGQVFKNIAAQIISSLVVQAGVKAIFEVAEGLAALGRYDFASAGNHFASAKLYGGMAAVGAVAAIGLRAAIGNSGAGEAAFNNSSSSATPSNDQTTTNREIVEGRKQAEQSEMEQIKKLLERGIKVDQTVRVESNDAHIVKVITKNGRDRGEVSDWFTYEMKQRGYG